MANKNSIDIRQTVVVGVMAAMVFASCMLSIPINFSIGGSTRIHLGNIVILLSGLILGGKKGGFAAGIGAFLFDIVYPGYISSAPFTLISRFLMAFICGSIAHSKGRAGQSFRHNITGAVSGGLFYIVVYFAKNFLESLAMIKGFWGAISTLRSGAIDLTSTGVISALTVASQKGLISLVNGAIGITISIPLCVAIRKALSKTNITL